MDPQAQQASRGGLGTQLTVAQQIGLIVGVAILALVVVLGLSLVRVQHLGATVDRLANEQVERLQLALRWRSNIAVNSTRVFSIVQSEGDDLQNYFKDMVAATTADTSKVQKRYTELENSPEGLRIQEELGAVRKPYLEVRDKALALKKAGDMAQAKSFALGSFAPVVDQYNAVADKMVAYQVRRSAEQAGEAAGLIQSYRTTVLVAGVRAWRCWCCCRGWWCSASAGRWPKWPRWRSALARATCRNPSTRRGVARWRR